MACWAACGYEDSWLPVITFGVTVPLGALHTGTGVPAFAGMTSQGGDDGWPRVFPVATGMTGWSGDDDNASAVKSRGTTEGIKTVYFRANDDFPLGDLPWINKLSGARPPGGALCMMVSGVSLRAAIKLAVVVNNVLCSVRVEGRTFSGVADGQLGRKWV